MTSSPGVIGCRFAVAPNPAIDHFRCDWCAHVRLRRPRDARRVEPRTRFDRFLLEHGIGITPLLHKLSHVSESVLLLASPSDRKQIEAFSDVRLRLIRTGQAPVTAVQRYALRLAVSDFVNRPVSGGELFFEEVASR